MISAIGVDNVRLFKGKQYNFETAPLTVFCGTNSSGKSTLLKIPLLLRQSQGIRESYESVPGKLRFVGSQVDFGDYACFVSDKNAYAPFEITIKIEDTVSSLVVDLLRSLKRKGKEGQSAEDAVEHSPRIVPYQLAVRFKFNLARGRLVDPSSTESLRGADDAERAFSAVPQGLLAAASFDFAVGGETLLSWTLTLVPSEAPGATDAMQYELTIPRNFFHTISWFSLVTVLNKDKDEPLVRLRAKLTGLLPTSIFGSLRGNSPLDEEQQWSSLPLPHLMAGAIDDFTMALSKINYLGPLRAPAKRYYLANLDASPTMDAAGEFLPYILKDRDRYDVARVRPECTASQGTEKLGNALNWWMHFLRTGESASAAGSHTEFTVCTTKDVIVELQLRSPQGEEWHALADSGFGYSQVLPILVRGLIAEVGSTLIIEQPELHLHPALQVRLASFFVALIQSGRHVMIETHSEHLVNALRVLIAEDQSRTLAKKSRIYFIDAERGVPDVHELSIADDGTVSDWPPNFFGESASLVGRLLRAQKQWRQTARGAS